MVVTVYIEVAHGWHLRLVVGLLEQRHGLQTRFERERKKTGLLLYSGLHGSLSVRDGVRRKAQVLIYLRFLYYLHSLFCR